MGKKLPRPSNENRKVYLDVESWRWETASSRFTWKHWLALAVLLAIAILLAFGFLVIAGIVLAIGIILNAVLFLFKKLS